jgi:hypothetical protein
LVSALDPAQAPPAGGGGDSGMPIISPDGRYVLFASMANNLVPGDTNGCRTGSERGDHDHGQPGILE